MSERWCKILVNGKSCHGGDLEWSLPENGKPGQWHEVAGGLEICRRGLHVVPWDKRFEWYKAGCTAYEAEARDIETREPDKAVARRVRLLRKMRHPSWWVTTMAFVDDLRALPWMQPQEAPDPAWRLFDTRGAARAAAGAEAGAEAGDAAWRAAGAEAGAEARAEARAAAWDAARDAAWRAAAGAAAGDAALWAVVLLSGIGGPHRDHAAARMDVWRRGYGLLCDVDGILYVYRGLK